MLSALLLGCGGEETGQGEVQIFAYGEPFIEEGIPASEMSDGWAVTFSRFDVQIAQVSIAGATLAGGEAVDLSMGSDGEGQQLGSLTVDEGSHGEAAYVIESVRAVGQATKDGSTKSFDWSIAQRTRYSGCETTTEVAADEQARFEITVHADHFFYDSLVSEDPALLFAPIAAADADDDGTITAEELEQAGIGSLDPGNEDISDMWSWLLAQSRTLGHVDGEGHCDAAADN